MRQNYSLPRNEILDYDLLEGRPRPEAQSPTPWMIQSNARAAYAIAHQCMQP